MCPSSWPFSSPNTARPPHSSAYNFLLSSLYLVNSYTPFRILVTALGKDFPNPLPLIQQVVMGSQKVHLLLSFIFVCNETLICAMIWGTSVSSSRLEQRSYLCLLLLFLALAQCLELDRHSINLCRMMNGWVNGWMSRESICPLWSIRFLSLSTVDIWVG